MIEIDDGVEPSPGSHEGPGSAGALVREVPPVEDAGPRSRPAPLQVALFVVPLLILAVGAWTHRWVTEDAFINFRIVEQTLAGHPFAFNAGERVEAGTSPLWIVILVVADVVLGWAVDLAWSALLIGLGLALFGVGAGMAGARILARCGLWGQGPALATARSGPGPLVVPAGALVLAVLPPMWDFSTSGLETGLTFGWIGGCFWALARRIEATRSGGDESAAARVARSSPARPRWLPVLLGLGPLVRPDLVLFSIAFLVVLLVSSAPGHRARLRALAWAVALPVAFEVFRMAYFATIVPNTALAKEATEADWASGLRYLDNFGGTYLLALPLILLVFWVLALVWARGGDPASRRLTVTAAAAPMAAAVIHAAYVTRVGGDFMHGRLLLPATFGLLLPVAALPFAAAGVRRTLGLGACAGVVVWSALCAFSLRLPYGGDTIRDGIADERAFWNTLARTEHAVTLDDHAGYAGVQRGRMGRELAARGADVLVLFDGTVVPLAPGSGVVLEATTIGLVSQAAGPEVRVIDSLGLADALGSRITGIDGDPRIGHEKRIPTAWIVARVTDPPTAGSANPVDETAVDPAQIVAARRALACPAVVELLEATAGDLTFARMLENARRSPALTRLRIPADPVTAATCPPS